MLNNDEWYGKMSAIELMGVARYLRMGTLLSRKSVEARLSSPVGMSFAEFSYQLFQAYDWLHLFKNYGCRFQVNICLRFKYPKNISKIPIVSIIENDFIIKKNRLVEMTKWAIL